MGFFLGVLLLMWAGIAATFVLPGFREINQLKSLDIRSRFRRRDDEEISDVHHVHAAPHAELRTKDRDVIAPAPLIRESTPRAPQPLVASTKTATIEHHAGMVFDTWSNKWVNLDGDVVEATSPAPMNPRAEAYRRARPDVEQASPRRPMAPSPNRPLSASRKAALRRRKVLKYMVIAISVTTVPAILTSWPIFMASATLTWLSFFTWFGIMVRQFVSGELTRESAASTRMEPSTFDALPDNVISMRRARPAPVVEVPADDDEFFDPRSVGGFTRAQYAVGE